MAPSDQEDTVVVKTDHQPKTNNEACLVNVSGTDICRRWKLNQERMIIGRSADCDIMVDEQGVSRFHAEIIRTPFALVVEDLDSTNGTVVNGTKVKRKRLSDGDQIRIGKAVFKFLESNNLESAYYEEVYRLTTTDDLTRTHNRRFFFSTMERELARAGRYGRDLSLIMFDIDHFKTFNDTYGHQAGDAVLVEVAQRVKSHCRQEDVLARYGGEEFSLLLPEVGMDGARKLAERVRRSIADEPFMIDGEPVKATISLGVSDFTELSGIPNPSGEEPNVEVRIQQFIRLADNKLYAAKQQGRDRVVA